MQTVTAKIYEPYVDYPNKYWIAPSIDFMEKTTTIPYAMNKLGNSLQFLMFKSNSKTYPLEYENDITSFEIIKYINAKAK